MQERRNKTEIEKKFHSVKPVTNDEKHLDRSEHENRNKGSKDMSTYCDRFEEPACDCRRERS